MIRLVRGGLLNQIWQRHLRLKDFEQAAAKVTRVAQISFGDARALTCMCVTGIESDNVEKASKV